MYGSSGAASGPTLSVDELEKKLRGLRDYLSTPYRARAEAVVLRRGEREANATFDRNSGPSPQPDTPPHAPRTPPEPSSSDSPRNTQRGLAAPPDVPPLFTEDAHARAYVQRLEWQVAMLAEALAAERRRAADIEVRVVQPLLELSEAALRRQAELECELAARRETEHD